MSVDLTTAAAPPRRRALPPRLRRVLLTVHIMGSVALLGDAAGYLAVAVRSATSTDPEVAAASWDILEMFSVVFGIPLTVTALLTGIALGIGSKWGVFRYPWVITKLLLTVSVMVVGGAVLGPGLELARAGVTNGEAMVIAGAAYDIVALSVATALSVFKPGRRRSRRAPRRPVLS